MKNIQKFICMRCMKLGLMVVLMVSAIAYGIYIGYLARLTYIGYCHTEDKHLTDEEKIAMALSDLLQKYPPLTTLALGDLLKKYPPSIDRKLIKVEEWSAAPREAWHMFKPEKPIYYRDVKYFLMMNPDCCKIYSTSTVMEGGELSLVEVLMGTATEIVEVNYLVRYWDEENVEKSIKTVDYLHITSCGTPGKPWSPY
jgi:hypothetical protein